MTFIYDVLSNFNDDIIEYFEWEKSDIIEHIKKIPFVRIKSEDYELIALKNLKFKKSFLDNIKDKTTIFNNQVLETVKYSCMFTNGEDALMVIINNHGFINEISKLPYDEERDVLEISSSLSISEIPYEKLGKKFKKSFLTRQEKKLINSIERELIFIKDDVQKINYLYYEWFSKTSKSNPFKILITDIKKEFTSKHEDFYKIIKLMSKTANNV